MAKTGQERTALYRLRHPDRCKESKRKRTVKLVNRKIEVLTHYGRNKCGCVNCGESRLACLSIDHIDGGGTIHRNYGPLRSSTAFYKWLRDNNYPDGYQTLCMNCQFVKRFENNEEHRGRGY